ncbi:MAG: hypothetical protein Q9218_006326, partial [Villophora microphyllina]
MLDHLRPALFQAAQDAESSTMSPAYRTFFKDAENKAYVSNILANMTAGAPIHPPTTVNDGGPVIVCLTSEGTIAGTYAGGEPYDAYTGCRNNPYMTSQSMSGTPYVTLCPFFWNTYLGTRRTIPPPNNCLSVDTRKNKFHVNRLGRAGPSMIQFAMWDLMKQIAHIYLIPEQSRRGVAPGESFDDANKLLPLSADRSLMSADSYVLYVA